MEWGGTSSAPATADECERRGTELAAGEEYALDRAEQSEISVVG